MKYRFLLLIFILTTCLLLLDRYSPLDLITKSITNKPQLLIDLYKSNLFEQFNSESKLLDLDQVVTNPQREEFTLRTLIGDSKKLVLKISDAHCNVCIDQELRLIKIANREAMEENIIIIAQFERFEKFYAFAKAKSLTSNVYFIGKNFENIPIDDAGTPYAFLVKNDGLLDSVFAPSKDLPENSQHYYYFIFSEYFNKRIEALLTE